METNRGADMQATDHRRRFAEGGAAAFTLIELLAVVMIIGILMSMILGVATWAQRANMEAKAKADIETLRTALDRCRMDDGQYPLAAAGTTAWTNAVRGNVPPEFDFLDPWNHIYRYICTAPATYRLYSMGADGAEGPPPEADLDNIEAGRF